MSIEHVRFAAGNPVPQPRQRHRAFIKNGKAMAHNYTPEKHPVQAWKRIIQNCFKNDKIEKIEGPIRLDLYFVIDRPKSHYRTGKNAHLLKDSAPEKWHLQKPDSDNFTKAVMDAINGLDIWNDDNQVCILTVQKVWIHKEQPNPGCHIMIGTP